MADAAKKPAKKAAAPKQELPTKDELPKGDAAMDPKPGAVLPGGASGGSNQVNAPASELREVFVCRIKGGDMGKARAKANSYEGAVQLGTIALKSGDATSFSISKRFELA